MMFEIIVTLTAFYLFFYYFVPYMKLKSVQQDCIDQHDFCMIDVRDYNLAYRNPFNSVSRNIPLSYLQRTTKEEEVCDKDIVIIAESKLAAAKAARILKRRTKRFIYYVTVT
ncbi:rhodanese-like domain-containing protein [Alkalihalobacillus sp. AL-G]|uniref:rhodanese-like domain-containing protein n=1 Tax=Alkalihalobacillus sp. AL-G TaxID=2926399 RepID=UPI0027296B10|nr:rhodanese-like domain-containing protein [Alkalihalobacillus sp. AL-G]WLD92444.1 rhodanese-like domain-containing protein [Alkalihalobacillus sp. AL-G]